jgi:hypothetical protein
LSRAFVKKGPIVTYRQIDGWLYWSLAKAEVQPLPGITHSKHVLRRCPSVRCGADMADTLSASTSSVTMHHTASRFFVAELHIVTCHVFEGLWVWSVAKAKYRHCQTAHCHHQLLCKDGSMSAVALGVGLGSLSHRAGCQFDRLYLIYSYGKIT